MTRFTDQQLFTRDGRNITVKSRPGVDLRAAAALPGMVTSAVEWLEKTSAMLAAKRLSHDVISLSRDYLGTGFGGPTAEEVLLMRQVVTMTLNGLVGDVTIKVGNVVGRDETNVAGEVHYGMKDMTKPYHNKVVGMNDPSHFVPWTAGAIRISQQVMAQGWGTHTVIHEATHKYAGTIDHCYFNKDTCSPMGDTKDRQKMLMNADGYAWLAMGIDQID